MPRRLIPLHNIGIRLLYRPGHPMTTGEPWGKQGQGVTWISCQMGKEADPEKPKPAKQPEWIFLSAVTAVHNPNYTTFSNPCSRFE